MKQTEKYHNFFLSPNQANAWTRCPQCHNKTSVRIFPIVVGIQPGSMAVLRQKCKFCAHCDLVIIQQEVLESLLAKQFHETRPELLGNDYLALGTLDNKDWQAQQNGTITGKEAISQLRPFKEYLKFDISLGGWFPKKDP